MSRKNFEKEKTLFRERGYCIVKNAVSEDLLSFLQSGFEMSTQNRMIQTKTGRRTEFGDSQCPNSYSVYTPPPGEMLCLHLTPVMEEITGKRLWPTYSYARIYYQSSVLKPHMDRPSCQYSATFNLEGDDSWPLSIRGFDNIETSVYLSPGDLCVYRGDLLEHWRDPYEGKEQRQIFLHYVDADGEFSHLKYDGKVGLNF